ncbi:hypothetical protein BT69DRAFT_1278974 [Atractiella rhizophila]|nr:hypothetical protein BT69DRAFT_1278974 [Atractiella rhizophila]
MATPVFIPPYSVIRDSVGAYLVGASVTILLTGWTLHQTASYYHNYPRDPFVTKTVIAALAVANILHVAFVFRAPEEVFKGVYQGLISNYGIIAAFGSVPFSYGANFIILALTTSVVQIWYASRIYVLGGKKRIAPIFVIFCALFQLGWGIAAGISTARVKEQRKFRQFSYVAYCWLGGAGLSDFIIVCLMAFYLLRSRQGFKGTTSVVNRIVLLTVQTNMITSVLQILDLILFLTMQSGWNIAINIGRYSNSVLTLLVRLLIICTRDSFQTSGYSGQHSSNGNGKGSGQHSGVEMERRTPKNGAAVVFLFS